MSSLSIHGLKKRFGTTQTIHGIDLDIAPGEFVVFVGPSGCGKSTLLRMIAGLESASEGLIQIGNRDVTLAPPSQRDVAMVFQSYALYPHMTVEENLTFGMRMRKLDKATIAAKLERAVNTLKLQPYLGRKPGELSGGQCQRVAIGRALVQEPSVFLFDEPLSNLDAELRLHMRVELGALHKELGKTMIYVTHDQVEAMTLADKIVVLRDGLIEQVGSPMSLYANPANEFVAGFIGSPPINLLPATVQHMAGEQAVVHLADGAALAVALMAPQAAGSAIKLGIRPEHLQPAEDGPLRARVLMVERLGAISYIYADYAGQRLCVQSQQPVATQAGDEIRLAAKLGWLYAFDSAGRAIAAERAC